MRRFHTLSIAILLLTAPGAFGQLPNVVYSGGGGGTRDGSFQGTATFRVPMPDFPVWAGAPYSGEQTDVSVQTLADGNTITNVTGYQQKAWRDSQGRVRVQRSCVPGPGASRLKNVPTIVQIQDPVAGYTYLVDDAHRAVHRILLVVAKPRATGVPSGNLGTQMIDGIEAVGNRTTMPGPGGSGTFTRDEWVSPDLHLTILAVVTDPAGRVATSKISNLSRTEPDPTLFQIPLDYTMVEESQAFTIKWGGN
jgi:hypothetical protein